MTSSPPSSLPPWGRGSRYPLRKYRFSLDDVVSWSEWHVLLKLGLPDEKRAGVEWQTDPPSQNVIVRDLAGNMAKGFSFEPVPHTIPPLQPYQSWFYHNVSGMTWKLYLTRRLNIPVMSWFWPRIVVEVYQYPTNAVF